MQLIVLGRDMNEAGLMQAEYANERMQPCVHPEPRSPVDQRLKAETMLVESAPGGQIVRKEHAMTQCTGSFCYQA